MKLSIVIPTKNRYETLFPVIEALLKHIEGADYEIVVHDNSDDNTLAEEYAKNKWDKRVKYFYSTDSLSQVSNSEAALRKAVGDYIIFIGDDDLVSPYIFTTLNMMDIKQINCLIYSPANYWWPNVKFEKPSKYRCKSSLQIPKDLSGRLIKHNSLYWRNAVLENGGFSMLNLPKCYHAIIRKKVLDKVLDKFGCYIPGPCPDMTLAVALTFVLDEYYEIKQPQSITGASNNSAAGLGTKGKMIARLDDDDFVLKKSFDITKWDVNIPRIFTTPTIWAQSVYEVCLNADYKVKINYLKLLARMNAKEKKDARIEVYKTLYKNNKGLSLLKYYFYYLKQIIQKCIVKIIDLTKGSVTSLNFNQNINVDSVDKCMEVFKKEIGKNSILL